MWVRWGFEDAASLPGDALSGVAVGAFDGVHRGHRELLQRVVEGARGEGLRAVAVTFHPLPIQRFQRPYDVLLSSLGERLSLLARLDLDGTVVLPFGDELIGTSAELFAEKLVSSLGMRALWAGPDFKLGARQEGDVPFLERLGRGLGFDVHALPPFLWRGQPVRSTRIREDLKSGQLGRANELLGRPYSLTGLVGHGHNRGRAMGFPTANLILNPACLCPVYGVYACRAHTLGGTFGAVTNVGLRPTFDGGGATVEAYLLDFDGDLYYRPLRLEFLSYLRRELKFESVADLVAQMERDVVHARALLTP
jgi:riboflavin kinase/FMN adenylyltransferase